MVTFGFDLTDICGLKIILSPNNKSKL